MAVTNDFMKTIFTMDEHVGQTYLKSGNGGINNRRKMGVADMDYK
jgi:hypothetical protein